MTVRQPRPAVYAIMFAYTLAIRLLPYALMRLGMTIDPESMAYPWNFSPALALCLYGGATFDRRDRSLLAPLALYLASDLGIWALTGRIEWAFYPAQWGVYAAVAACAACGWIIRQNRSWLGVAGCAAAAPMLFFLMTNFACWVGSTRFEQSLSGLIQCYAAGLLHHRNLTASTLLFSAVLFSPLCVRTMAPARDPEATTAAA